MFQSAPNKERKGKLDRGPSLSLADSFLFLSFFLKRKRKRKEGTRKKNPERVWESRQGIGLKMTDDSPTLLT